MFAGITFATEGAGITGPSEAVCDHDCGDGSCDFLYTGECNHECDEDCGGLTEAGPDGVPGAGEGVPETEEGDADATETGTEEEEEALPISETEPAKVSVFDTVVALASGTSSDLADFVTAVTITDISTTPPTVISPPANPSDPPPTFLGRTYQFAITFAENSQLQMEYDANGKLTYQLPSDLSIPNPISVTPIYSGASNGNAIIGWYTISTSGLVQMWFDDVDLQGNPTPSGVNFIDYYSNVSITLDILAQLTGGGDLDFGNDIEVGIEPPVPPPVSLTMQKTSQYIPSEERIWYMITITALNGSINNIALDDTPAVNGYTGNINNPTSTAAPNGAFSGFVYQVNRVGQPPGSWMPMTPVWTSTNPAAYRYNFVDASGAPLVLGLNDFITVRYYVNLQPLIANNSAAGQALAGTDPLNYNFTVNNTATVTGNDVSTGVAVPPVSDTTVDYVKKQFVMTKTGTWLGGNRIQWGITIGDGKSVALNGGTVTDTHSGGAITMPAASAISITFYGAGGTRSVVSSLGSALLPIPPATLTATGFSFIVPAQSSFPTLTTAPAGSVYQISISYITTINNLPILGEPTEIFSNDVTFTFPGTGGDVFGGGASVPVKIGNVNIAKSTGGICGNPGVPTGPNGENYWVDYTITVEVPGGLLNEPLYLYDNLGLFSGGIGVPNLPTNPLNNLSVSAAYTDPTNTSPVSPALNFAGPVQYATSTNAWRLFFGDTTVSATDNTTWKWQYNDPVTLTISYRMFLNAAAVALLQGGRQLQNAIYLINSMGNPDIGSVGNSVGGVNTNDMWPIIKSVTPTGNPTLFNYSATIKGAYSGRADALLSTAGAPVYTDVFDSRMEYVPGTFYIADTSASPPLYFVPGPDVVPTGSPPNTISVGLSGTAWQQYRGTYPNGIPMALTSGWFALKHNYVVNYQLMVSGAYINNPISPLNNTADISVNPGACDFQSSASVDYAPQNLGKTMDPVSQNADVVDVTLIINADGEFVFSSPGPDPVLITATDTLTNLSIFTATIQYYTQTKNTTTGIWDGVWIPAPPTSFNTGAAWSVTPVSSTSVNLIFPSMTPVMVTYKAQVTLTPGTPGTISNTISVLGNNTSAGGSYTVSNTGVGANAGRTVFRVFKKDPLGNNLQGAVFNLYVTDITALISGSYRPPAGISVARTITGSDGTQFRFGLLSTVTTDAGGTALFNNQWINSTQKLLYMLVETKAPDGYQIITTNQYTYFTLAPTITSTQIDALDVLLDPSLGVDNGGVVNQLTDFTTVVNAFAGEPYSVRIIKEVRGLSASAIRKHLQGFQLIVTDPLDVVHTYTIDQVLPPDGVVLQYTQFEVGAGTFFFEEENYLVPGYTVVTTPRLPSRYPVNLNANGEVVFRIQNAYRSIHHGGHDSATGDYSNMLIWQLSLLASALGLLCILMWRWRDRRFTP